MPHHVQHLADVEGCPAGPSSLFGGTFVVERGGRSWSTTCRITLFCSSTLSPGRARAGSEPRGLGGPPHTELDGALLSERWGLAEPRLLAWCGLREYLGASRRSTEAGIDARPRQAGLQRPSPWDRSSPQLLANRGPDTCARGCLDHPIGIAIWVHCRHSYPAVTY